MLKSILGLSAVALATAIATPALADDDGLGLTINGSATVVSDYRFRGISQTNRKFAVQGSLTVSHESGFYVSAWGSSIDDYVAFGSDQEIDLIAGYKKTFSGVTVDGGVLYYYYPGSSELFSHVKSDFAEPYLSVSGALGPVTAKVGAAYAPKQHALSYGANAREDNLYVYGELSGAIPGTPLTIGSHLGYTAGRSYLSLGFKNYIDYSVTASYTYKALTFGATFVGTDFKKSDGIVGFNGKRIAKPGFLGSVGVSF
jgi:uncharacterized protein (TIGR02001 family)